MRVGVELGVAEEGEGEEVDVAESPHLLPVQLIAAQTQDTHHWELREAMQCLYLWRRRQEVL